MRHRSATKHLGRSSSHRRAMRRNMAASLIQHEAVRTTEPQAKHMRRFVERLITLAKKGTLHARRRVIAELSNVPMVDQEGEPTGQTVVQKLFDEIAPRYADRPGGYTRIIRLAERRIGDAGSQVLLQLVEETSAAATEKETTSRRKKRATKRIAAAGDATTDADADKPVEPSAEGDAAADEDAESPAPDDTADPSDADEEETKES